jgi:hypothetical protein
MPTPSVYMKKQTGSSAHKRSTGMDTNTKHTHTHMHTFTSIHTCTHACMTHAA